MPFLHKTIYSYAFSFFRLLIQWNTLIVFFFLIIEPDLHFHNKIHLKVLVAQSCLTLCDTIDYSLPGFSVHGILQAWILERITTPFSRGSSQPRDGTLVSCIVGRFFTIWATREAHSLGHGVLFFLLISGFDLHNFVEGFCIYGHKR